MSVTAVSCGSNARAVDSPSGSVATMYVPTGMMRRASAGTVAPSQALPA